MTLTQLYFFTIILPNAAIAINGIAISLGIIAGSIMFCGWFVASIQEDMAILKTTAKYAIRCAVGSLVLSLIAIPLPSDRQLYMLAGGYVATNTKDVAKLPDNVVKAANAWLEKAATIAEEKPKE